ncbi:hypothetical protein BpHYR1_037970 [Brachionus plicatilis]|uniref:Uncharacterized protein n=1 Tax=Brachionus plicatilis TaxID=10195 RepID=A0A3M7QMY6_BRAPC|nr:hypothetical protein BpHYR1_037970 [Brachionus plicatilis]
MPAGSFSEAKSMSSNAECAFKVLLHTDRLRIHLGVHLRLEAVRTAQASKTFFNDTNSFYLKLKQNLTQWLNHRLANKFLLKALDIIGDYIRFRLFKYFVFIQLMNNLTGNWVQFRN